MNRKVLLLGLAVVVPVIALLVMSLGRNPNSVKSPLIGRDAPVFSLRSVGSTEAVSLEGLRGKPVVLNFWATWCVPCFQEHKVLTAAAQQLQPNVQFLAIVYNDEEQTIQEFLSRHGSAYPSLMDDRGKTAIAYGVYGVPETFFIDPGGRIVAKHEGPVSQQVLADNIRKAMVVQ